MVTKLDICAGSIRNRLSRVMRKIEELCRRWQTVPCEFDVYYKVSRHVVYDTVAW